MLIMGIDPGTVVTGYAVIRREAVRCSAVDYGNIRPPNKEKLSQRYALIYQGVDQLLRRFRPDVVAVETQFVAKNPQSSLKLGMARGMILLAATQQGIPVFEYSPCRAKQAVTGNGRASKQQVQGMVTQLLGLSAIPESEDTADALAIALCHAQACDYHHLIGEIL
jgi:crossover junction endodeoxyribonuclease RuvC